MKVVTVAEMQELERRADAAGVSFAQMMEWAGRAVADEIARRWEPRGLKVLVLVGPGNNGGDGLVAARSLHDKGVAVWVYLWRRDTQADPLFAFVREREIMFTRAEEDADYKGLCQLLGDSAVVVDALLGTGTNRPVEGALAALLGKARDALTLPPHPHPEPLPPVRLFRGADPSRRRPDRRPPAVVAVDLPSGMNADSGLLDPATVPAQLTVTFACPKKGFFRFPAADALGELVVADIGIPAAETRHIALEAAVASDIAAVLPRRPRAGHKGTFGRALIISGSAQYIGAPALAAVSAGRAGAGLVTLATPPEVVHTVAGSMHEPTYLPLPATQGAIDASAISPLFDVLGTYAACLVGPGIGRAAPTSEFLRAFLRHRPLPPLVLDADALNLLSAEADWWRLLPEGSILTPHAGEFARLSGLLPEEIAADREGVALAHARRWNQIVMLKGAFTVLADPDGQVTILPFANPALATAGSGDVLAGAIVGLLAQGMSPRLAAQAGGFVHGLAGELAREEIGDAGVLAGDLPPRIPRALRQLKENG